MTKMNYLLEHDLCYMFGDETKSLSMRFGLHSGPVTAGVLRGEKSRFQLFGNTGTYPICRCGETIAGIHFFIFLLTIILQ